MASIPIRGAWQQIQERISMDSELGRYMQLSFDAFHSSAEWPDIERLQRQLVRQNDSLDLYAIGARIPIELGNNPARMDNRCFLNAAGIALCTGSEEEIDDFLRVLELAVQKYLTADDNQNTLSEITSTELAETFGMTALQLGRIYRMIEWETFIAGGAAKEDGSWHRQVSNLTRHFVKVAPRASAKSPDAWAPRARASFRRTSSRVPPYISRGSTLSSAGDCRRKFPPRGSEGLARETSRFGQRKHVGATIAA